MTLASIIGDLLECRYLKQASDMPRTECEDLLGNQAITGMWPDCNAAASQHHAGKSGARTQRRPSSPLQSLSMLPCGARDSAPQAGSDSSPPDESRRYPIGPS